MPSSPRNKDITALILAFLATAGLIGGVVWWLRTGLTVPGTNSISTPSTSAAEDRISVGDKVLLKLNDDRDKRAGTEAIASGNFTAAMAALQQSLRTNRNDPETVISLSNAEVGTADHYTIAVSVPISDDPNGSMEILRGVAQAQQEVNAAGGIGGKRLKVAIANDDNDPEIAKQVAATLAKDVSVLGVVGPYASDVSLAVAPTYQTGQLVAISPISTSVKLSGYNPFFFRTVPSDHVAARALANYFLTKLQHKKAAVFFNSQSSYSQSLKSEFVTALSLGGGEVIAEFDLSDPSLSLPQSVESAIRGGAEALMLAVDTSTLDKALQAVQVNRQRVSLLSGDDVYTPKTLEVGGAAAVNMVVAVPWHVDGAPNSEFPRRARALWGGDVNWRSALSYDAAQALIAAIKQNPTRTGVQQVLANPAFVASGASGTVRFQRSGDRNAPVQLVKITPGRRSGIGYDFVPIAP